MSKYRVRIARLADEHILTVRKSGDKGTLRKMQKIIDELIEHPYDGTGNPEQLKYELAGLWSRRINKKDRIIYAIDDESMIVSIISVTGHYSDK